MQAKLVKGAKAEVHKTNVPYLKEWYGSCGNFPSISMPICLISKLFAKVYHVADLTKLVRVQVTICMCNKGICTQPAQSLTFTHAQA